MVKLAICSLVGLALLLTPFDAGALKPPHDSSADPGIGCSSCHSMHGGYGLTPRDDQQEAMCKSCHNPTGQADGMTEVANHTVKGGSVIIDCGSCHDPHAPHETTDPHPGGQTAENLKLIRGDIAKYFSGALEPAIFQERPAHFAFDESHSPWNGICQACHTETDHHRKDAGSDHGHNVGLSCTTCHLHESNFHPVGGCSACHDKMQHGRRRIFGSNGDFEKNSHHVTGSVQDSDCAVCHYTGDHSKGTVRLKDPDQGYNLIYDYNSADPAGLESFCINCHDADGAAAGGGTQPFSDGQTAPDLKSGNKWANSAHNQIGYSQNGGNPITCFGDGATTGCHGNAHGSDNQKLLNASSGVTIDQFCYNCHTNAKITNNALSGSGLADDIEQAFSLSKIHDLDTTFTSGSNTYTLQCTTCHNPHIVTGKHWSVDQGKSPLTRPDFSDPTNNPRAMGTALWGDEPTEKMDYYAGSGTYRTPNGDAFSGSELPDYVTFCQDCHGQSGPVSQHFNLNWSGDPHGGSSANSPNGGGTCPDRYTCGKGRAWDGDECTGTQEECWPVMIRGKGDQLWSRGPYNHEERIDGANFILSCTDCHEAHGSSVRSMLRTVVNNGPGSTIWNTMCNNCHYYYSDWHAGMSCGNASCHVSDDMNAYGGESIHRMANKYGTGATRTFDPDLVADMRFENNLDDSGDWRMHGVWRVSAGSFVSGRSGQAIEINDQPVELGTRNSYWSTDEGQHGTWKYTEMKYNMTLEAWISPSVDDANERKIMAKHTYTSGGYALVLKQFDNTLRVAFLTNVDPGQKGVWDADCNGLRGAYSTVTVPTNRWTHVGATYDSTGPDRDPNDGSVGRVRIYVNGEDVTTSYSDDTQCFTQPGAGETAMFPYSDHNADPVGECYNDSWCASAFSVGGLNWSAPNDNFIGKIDEVKVWNITKPASYFDEMVGPVITKVEGISGYDQLYVKFSEGAYSDTGGALGPDDFLLNDVSGDGAKTITGVTHAAGDTTAIITISPALKAEDINTDTLAAASNSIYDEYANNAAFTDAVGITAMPSPSISSVEGLVGSDKLKVTFSSQVYANKGQTGALESADFVLDDVDNNNSRAISSVQHTAGESIAILTMSNALAAADVNKDTLAAAGGSIFGPGDHPVGIEAVTITAQTAPAITRVEGAVGYDKLFVSFTEGVYTNTGQSGALGIGDFTLTDNDNGRDIDSVSHTAGSNSAIVTLSSALDATDDVGVDTLSANSNAIYNNIGNPVGTGAVTITGNDCPAWGTSFQLNEPGGSTTVQDETTLLSGTVNNPAVAMPGDGSFHGDDEQNTYIDFTGNSSCLNSPRAITVEARVKPTEVDKGVGVNTFNRIFERRRTILVTILNTDYRGDDIPERADKASIEVKYRVDAASRHTCPHPQWPDDSYIGNDVRMHQISSDIDQWPIVNNHWYLIKIVFNSDKSEVPGSNGTPVDVFIDDLGTDGNGAGENWTGYKNATKTINESSSCKWGALPGDFIEFRNDSFHIGANWNHAQAKLFEGLIDWVTWKPVADYSGVDDPPK